MLEESTARATAINEAQRAGLNSWPARMQKPRGGSLRSAMS